MTTKVLRQKSSAIVLCSNTPRPLIMGIINASPNSFYGACHSHDEALRLAEKMVQAGADILDVGGEATSPTVDLRRDQPTVQQEIARVVPIITAIKKNFSITVSVDTSQPQVMQAALAAGADMINDQRALTIPGAAEVVLQAQVPVCLMHFILPPRQPGSSTPAALLQQIKRGLKKRAEELMQQGLVREKIILDPGFGGGNYGKSTAENFYILKHLDELTALGYPILAGWSRKSMLGEVLDKPPEERLYGSIAAAVLCVLKGASILRVHDVRETVEALKVVSAVV